MSHVAEKVLEKTLEDLQIRAEVETTLQSMLVALEVAASLRKDLVVQSQLAELEQQVVQNESALGEMQAIASHQRLRQTSLADSLVQELWTLSQELGELKRWKETHERTVVEHDEVVAKLLYAEEQIRVLEATGADANKGSFDRSTTPDDDPVAGISEQCVEEDASSTAVKVTTVCTEAKPAHEVVDEIPLVEESDTQADIDETEQAVPETAGAEPEEGATVPVEQAGPDDVPAGEEHAVVALLQEEDVPSLDTIDIKVLAEIFEYLDALEILSSAQVNVTMYSRVDALFGLTGGVDVGEPAVPPSQQQEAPIPLPAELLVASLATTVPPTVVSGNFVESTSTVARLPLQQPSSNVNTTLTVELPRRGGIFSLLQNRGGPGGGLRKSTAATTDQPLSAAMTDSMVAKLTDKELSAIFSLTEKLHQREKAVASLTKEKEELLGKLEGTEALKEFLINKVRDVEQSLRKSQEDEIKVTQQISSDQEVIAFLDGRVQELERNISSLIKEKKTNVEEMIRLKEQNGKKIQVLSDMLQFERDRVSANEREWKATKKLLVKEIKSCRAQLIALQAERDGFREQNERLRKAVLSMNASNGGM